MECFNFRSHTSGTLQGFADVRVPNMGIELYGCAYHKKGDKEWVNLPSREYVDENGEKKYISTIKFIEKDDYHNFTKKLLLAVKQKAQAVEEPMDW